jgi:YVTN family beta-propeller protein
MQRVAALLLAGSCFVGAPGWAADPAPLVLETKIPLGSAKGRIDHLAVDLRRQRLYVAELGNDSVGAIDLKNGKVIQTITGLKDPTASGARTSLFVPETDRLYVAVRASFSEAAAIWVYRPAP